MITANHHGNVALTGHEIVRSQPVIGVNYIDRRRRTVCVIVAHQTPTTTNTPDFKPYDVAVLKAWVEVFPA
jgi:hypothetical protein